VCPQVNTLKLPAIAQLKQESELVAFIKESLRKKPKAWEGIETDKLSHSNIIWTSNPGTPKDKSNPGLRTWQQPVIKCLFLSPKLLWSVFCYLPLRKRKEGPDYYGNLHEAKVVPCEWPQLGAGGLYHMTIKQMPNIILRPDSRPLKAASLVNLMGFLGF
jgi:hypothetical protein